MPFTIIRNDITKLNTDAIVNAANEALLEGGGVCGAIFKAAGAERLKAECDTIGHCATGDAVITKGYNLPAKYIIHTVGPVYGQNPKEEENLLYSCYEKSLMLAKNKNLSSIAFPLISSGIYGYPKAEALKIATRAVKNFLDKNEMDIYLVVYDKKSFEISGKLFESVQSFIDEKLVKPDFRSRAFCLGATAVAQPPLDIKPEQIKSKEACAEYSHREENNMGRRLEDLFERDVETFSQMLLRLIDEKGMTDVEVYKRANVDRKLFSKIRGKNYTPRKHTVMALAVSLRLSLDETIDLMKRAGYAFSECDKFDVIVEYFIGHGRYDIFEINEALFYYEQQQLGA